jgi:hypothetical protein
MAVNETGAVPPANKRSMVSEGLDIKEVSNIARKEMDKPDFMPSPQILELFKVEKLHDIATALIELVDIFKTAKGMVTQTIVPKQPVTQTSTPSVPVQTPQIPQSTGDGLTSSRLTEIKEKLKEFLVEPNPLLIIDENTSAQFIIVKPNGFLGGGNFPKIAGIIKNDLGGEYVSQGKGSHFKVPKLKQ